MAGVAVRPLASAGGGIVSASTYGPDAYDGMFADPIRRTAHLDAIAAVIRPVRQV